MKMKIKLMETKHILSHLCVFPAEKQVMEVRSQDYMRKLVEQANLHFIATGKVKETGQIITSMRVVTLHTPKLSVEVGHIMLHSPNSLEVDHIMLHTPNSL
jgi:hypothetical protein